MASAFILNIFSGIENWKRDLTTNHATLDPQSADPLLRPSTLTGSPGEIADAIKAWTTSQPLWAVESLQENESTVKIHLTRTTRLLRFVDDIRVTLTGEGDHRTLIHAESQSRIGKGDLGQNPRNLRALISGLREQLQQSSR